MDVFIAAKVSALEKCCYVREVLNDDIFAELAGACGPMLKLRSSKLELARAWEVSNETLEQQFEALATERNFLTPVDGYHCAQFEDIMSIITNGFLTDRNRRSGQGVSVNIHCQNAINFSDENLFCLRCRVNVGKVFPTDEKIEDPALALKVLKDGYHSISLKNSTIVVYHSRQILPKYLFLFKKARKRELSRINTLEALPDVGITITQHNDTLHKCPPAVGRVAMTSDFICVLCTNPMFTHHCIITPRREIIWKELIASDIPLIQRMVEFAETIKLRFEEKEKTSTKAPQQYRIGFLPNPANELSHSSPFPKPKSLTSRTGNFTVTWCPAPS
ncbi:hypothetical protein Pelo_19003 [Pelomyxa schiedti]|nr:hypothetical protein Pelo_19003 [Pelomyxa schiedti]